MFDRTPYPKSMQQFDIAVRHGNYPGVLRFLSEGFQVPREAISLRAELYAFMLNHFLGSYSIAAASLIYRPDNNYIDFCVKQLIERGMQVIRSYSPEDVRAGQDNGFVGLWLDVIKLLLEQAVTYEDEFRMSELETLCNLAADPCMLLSHAPVVIRCSYAAHFYCPPDEVRADFESVPGIAITDRSPWVAHMARQHAVRPTIPDMQREPVQEEFNIHLDIDAAVVELSSLTLHPFPSAKHKNDVDEEEPTTDTFIEILVNPAPAPEPPQATVIDPALLQSLVQQLEQDISLPSLSDLLTRTFRFTLPASMTDHRVAADDSSDAYTFTLTLSGSDPCKVSHCVV
jgi:hypothetical protein